MVLDNLDFALCDLRSLFLKAVKQKSCALPPLVYYRYGFKEAHPASNVTWVTLEMPYIIITFIDFKKAFDTIYRGNLIKILAAYNIPERLVRAIKAILKLKHCRKTEKQSCFRY